MTSGAGKPSEKATGRDLRKPEIGADGMLVNASLVGGENCTKNCEENRKRGLATR